MEKYKENGDVYDIFGNKALSANSKYKNADINGKLVYFPKEFSEKHHQGKTKLELLKKQREGWNVMFIENLPNIPQKGEEKEIKGRKQLEAGKTPLEYLEILKTNPDYKNETGMTPEDQIIYAMKYLEQNNQIIDDYFGNGSSPCQLGSYFHTSESEAVPLVYWDRINRQACLSWQMFLRTQDESVRTSVRF